MSLVNKSFDFEGVHFNCLAIVTSNNNIYCKLKELSILLGYADPKKAYPLIDDQWKFTWSRLAEYEGISSPHPACSNWQPNTLFVSEPGIYCLMFRSKKPQAKQFGHHVLQVVLPEIRKTGAYISPNITASQLNNTIEKLQEVLAEKNRLLEELNETRGELIDKDRLLNETHGMLNETRGELTEKDRLLNETHGMLNETRGMLEETQGVVVEKNRVLAEIQAEQERMVVETRVILAEKNRILAEESHQKRQLQNNMEIVRPKVAIIPDSQLVRHTLSVFKHESENKYICIRTQNRSFQQALRRIPETFHLVFRVDNVPNAINIINRLRELLPNAFFRHNQITSNANVIDLIVQCIETETNRPILYNSTM